MTPRATPNYIDECKHEPKISSKDFPKVNDPTISEFMTTFSAWIRVPGHRVLRCGSLQIKSEKNCRFFVHRAGAKDSEGVRSIGPRMGLGLRQYVNICI